MVKSSVNIYWLEFNTGHAKMKKSTICTLVQCTIYQWKQTHKQYIMQCDKCYKRWHTQDLVHSGAKKAGEQFYLEGMGRSGESLQMLKKIFQVKEEFTGWKRKRIFQEEETVCAKTGRQVLVSAGQWVGEDNQK